MTRKIGFLLFSLLLGTALVLSSCGTATTINPTAIQVTGITKPTSAAATTTQVTTTAVATVATTTTAGPETMVNTLGKTILKPQYGGTYITVSSTDIQGFDNMTTYNHLLSTVNLTNEPLILGDWAKGPAGTGQTSFQIAGVLFMQYTIGAVAESWEIPDGQTIIYHIRHGLHFQYKPPVNGRELDAYDVEFSLKRDFYTPTAYLGFTFYGDLAPLSITATDKWTVVCKTNIGKQGPFFIRASGFVNIFPKDGAASDGTFKNWKDSNGTGPFILTDYVPNSSSTMVKRTDYWRKDPLTNMQIPYVDKVINLVVPDESTRIAGLQTGKIDSYMGVSWDNAEALKKTNPELIYGSYVSATTYSIHMALGKGFPWDKKEVRWALSRAINREKIINDFYGGNAVNFAFPIAPIADLSGMFTPLAELPQNVQDLYKYDVNAAKKLLADAGQGAGFKAEIIVTSASQTQQDLLSLIASMWKDINVTLTIKPLENAVWTAQTNARTFTNMSYWYDGNNAPYNFNNWRPGGPQNAGNIDSPELMAVYDKISAVYPFDMAAADKLIKEYTPYILDNCWIITPPHPKTFWFIQPWLHNYDGEISAGYYQSPNLNTFRWLDSKLKAKGK